MAQKYQVVVTEQAEKSLENLLDYLKEKASNEMVEKVRSGIIEEIRGLAEMPHRHGLLRGVDDLRITYRRVLKWSYRIIFTIEEDDLLVLVVEIDRSTRDPKDLKKILI